MSFTLSPFQQRVLGSPQQVSPLLLGGRGGGKTVAINALVVQHAQLYGPHAKMLFLRRTYNALTQPFDNAQDTWHSMGVPFTANIKDMRIDFANGAQCTFAPLDSKDYFRARFQGSSYSLLIHDELAGWPTPELPDMSMSLLRAPAPVVPRYVCGSNPGPGSIFITPRYFRPAMSLPRYAPFVVPELGDRLCAVFHSTFRDNPNISAEEALRGIAAGAAGNRALRSQYESGDFDSHVGLAFELTPANFSDDWPVPFDVHAFPWIKVLVGYDHGSRSVWSAVWLAKFRESGLGPDGRYYPRGSYVVFYEASSADPDAGYARPTMHANVGDISGEILRANEYLHVGNPEIQADAAIFSDHGSAAQSLGAEFKRYGLNRIVPAPKPKLRVTLARLRELIANAGQEAVPGLYFVRRTTPYAVTAFSQAVADEKDVEVLDPSYALDHAIDAVKYGIEGTSSKHVVRTSPMFPTNREQTYLDHFEREARAALRERQRFAMKAPPAYPAAKPTFFADLIAKSEARRAQPQADAATKPKAKPALKSGTIQRSYE